MPPVAVTFPTGGTSTDPDDKLERGHALSRAIHALTQKCKGQGPVYTAPQGDDCGGGLYSQLQHTPAWLCSQTNVLTKPTLDFATCLFLSTGARIEVAVSGPRWGRALKGCSAMGDD